MTTMSAQIQDRYVVHGTTLRHMQLFIFFQGGVLYVSASVLELYNPEPDTCLPKHGLLDDMESAYYVLFTAMVAQNSNGTLVSPQHKLFDNWASKSPLVSSSAKKNYVSMGYLGNETIISPGWSKASLTALEKWRQIFAEVHLIHANVAGLNTAEKIDTLKTLIKNTFTHYRAMIGALDTALQDMAARLGLDIPDPLPIEGPLTIKLRPLPQHRRLFSDSTDHRLGSTSDSQVTKAPRKREFIEMGDGLESPLKERRRRVDDSGLSRASRNTHRTSVRAGSSKLHK